MVTPLIAPKAIKLVPPATPKAQTANNNNESNNPKILLSLSPKLNSGNVSFDDIELFTFDGRGVMDLNVP